MLDLRSKIRDYKRVLRIARKPSKDDFTTSAKVTAMGLVIIGVVGFLIFLGFVYSCSNFVLLC